MTARFLELHHRDRPLLLPNAWDEGSARLLAAAGFEALATSSSGVAASMGRLDGRISRQAVLERTAAIVAATSIPVSADLERGFADEAADVAESYRQAVEIGLAGASIEDATGRPDDPIYDLPLAVERVAAAVGATRGSGGPAAPALVITARCEQLLFGGTDIGAVVERLVAYAEAGADVVFAPGLRRSEDIARAVQAVPCPLSVLALDGVAPVDELAGLGVARISVGGGFAFAALGALVEAATEFREQGTYGFRKLASVGVAAARTALT